MGISESKREKIMNNSELYNLYDKLLHEQEGKAWSEEWHQRYKALHTQALEYCVKGFTLPHSEKQRIFLEELLYKNFDNRIASKGLSTLSWATFNNLIEDEEFITALNDLFRLFADKISLDQLEMVEAKYQAFKEIWLQKKGNNNPVITNRIIATLTLHVSSTVDRAKFNQVLAYLAGKNFIDMKDYDYKPWLTRNYLLMEALRNAFKDHNLADTIDDYYLSIFVWMIYLDIQKKAKPKLLEIKSGND